jgi:thiamine-phosphate pyrophosphorylase
MTTRVTPAVDRAYEAARRWAALLGAAAVSPTHLLLGLLEEEEGRPALLFAEQGLSPATLRSALGCPAESLPEANPGGAGDGPEPASRSPLIYAARELALELAGEGTVATEHLLLALLKAEGGVRAALEAVGFELAKLEGRLRAAQPPPLQLEEPLHLVEPTEAMDAARILDANANRAREALRVVEDYCRFVLGDAFLAGAAKSLRHGLTEALGEVPAGLLLEARDTPGDVGTALRTPAEEQRYSPAAVAQANLKRLQEALRTLEEYGKLRSKALGRRLEALRYQSYTLERAVLIGTAARDRLSDARLYVLVSGAGCTASLEWTIKEAVAGGAQVIQLREKGLSDRGLLARARNVRRWTREAGALFIMNDRPDLARLAEADGVHVGQDELPVHEVRRIVGPDLLIGVSTHSLAQARQAVLDGASYIGVGPTFPSMTKEFTDFPGLEFVRQVAAETSLPAFAVGGVALANVAEVVAAGLRRVAVSSAICQADDPQAVAAAFRRQLT